jgi:hypothetical protein
VGDASLGLTERAPSGTCAGSTDGPVHERRTRKVSHDEQDQEFERDLVDWSDKSLGGPRFLRARWSSRAGFRQRGPANCVLAAAPAPAYLVSASVSGLRFRKPTRECFSRACPAPPPPAHPRPNTTPGRRRTRWRRRCLATLAECDGPRPHSCQRGSAAQRLPRS